MEKVYIKESLEFLTKVLISLDDSCVQAINKLNRNVHSTYYILPVLQIWCAPFKLTGYDYKAQRFVGKRKNR